MTYKREEMIEALERTDRNGCFSDADCEAEGLPPMTEAECVAIIQGWADDAGVSFEAMAAEIGLKGGAR